MIAPDDVEIRVVGCLVEKQRTTPDQYPLTLNSLRLACNQSTNRDPVVDYDEATIRRALGDLGRRRWIRSASGHTSRVAKYRHLIDIELNLPEDQLAMLAVLMLRGPQTPGELKQRTERMHHFEDLTTVQRTLEDLIERDLVERLERRPGQKEERYRHLLGGGDAAAPGPAVSGGTTGSDLTGSDPTGSDAGGAGATEVDLRHGIDELPGEPDAVAVVEVAEPAVATPVDSDRIDRLEREVEDLRAELAELRDRLGA
jgi:uncharacterized protein YceH (UPF0502 family)